MKTMMRNGSRPNALCAHVNASIIIIICIVHKRIRRKRVRGKQWNARVHPELLLCVWTTIRSGLRKRARARPFDQVKKAKEHLIVERLVCPRNTSAGRSAGHYLIYYEISIRVGARTGCARIIAYVNLRMYYNKIIIVADWHATEIPTRNTTMQKCDDNRRRLSTHEHKSNY